MTLRDSFGIYPNRRSTRHPGRFCVSRSAHTDEYIPSLQRANACVYDWRPTSAWTRRRFMPAWLQIIRKMYRDCNHHQRHRTYCSPDSSRRNGAASRYLDVRHIMGATRGIPGGSLWLRLRRDPCGYNLSHRHSRHRLYRHGANSRVRMRDNYRRVRCPRRCTFDRWPLRRKKNAPDAAAKSKLARLPIATGEIS